MKIDLTDAQVSLIIDGLRALQENAAYENKCTSDSEIHDSNNQMADEVDDLCEYLNCCEEVTPEVAICVKGGLVSSVYANANMDVDVYDLDVSDFPDEGEQEAADQKEAELDELVKSPGCLVRNHFYKEEHMSITYDVSKQKGSSRWYPHKIETPKVPAGPLGDKKQALHAAAELMGVSYPEYMELRRKKGCA